MAATALAVVGASLLPGASASGGGTIVVRGTALPLGARAQLTTVGCSDVFAGAAAPGPAMIGVGPAGGLGKRSLGFDPPGGSAVGLVGYVPQVGATSVASLSVYAPAGSTGVAYAGYQAPGDRGTTRMWIGRAPLSVAASSGWTSVSAAGLDYTWRRYDMLTGRPVGGAAGAAGLQGFLDDRGGDGYGFYAIAFGCDGQPVNLDGWRIGAGSAVTTYDFEGYAAEVQAGDGATIDKGEAVTLTATVETDLPAGAGALRAVLEQQHPDGEWVEVATRPGDAASVEVRPERTTTYRWKVYNTPMVEGSESTVTVKVEGEKPSDKPSDKPTDKPTRKPTRKPTEKASPSATPTKSATPSKTPSKSPSAAPDKTPSAAPSKSPSAAPSKSPSAAPSKSPSASPSATSSSTAAKPSDKPSDKPSQKASESPSGGSSPRVSDTPSAAE